MSYYKDKNNNLHFLEDENFKHLLPEGCTLITDDEANVIIKSKKPIKTYIDKRFQSYPSINEQLDMLYHDMINNTTTWKDKITEIKTTFPKE